MTTIASPYKQSSQSLPGWLILGAAAVVSIILSLSSVGSSGWLKPALQLISTVFHLALQLLPF